MNYGSLRALDGLSLSIKPGELFAFLGPNAAGKTTTIKLLTGLLVERMIEAADTFSPWGYRLGVSSLPLA